MSYVSSVGFDHEGVPIVSSWFPSPIRSSFEMDSYSRSPPRRRLGSQSKCDDGGVVNVILFSIDTPEKEIMDTIEEHKYVHVSAS